MGRNRTQPKSEHVGYCAKLLNPKYAKNPNVEQKWFDIRLFDSREEALEAAAKQFSWIPRENVRIQGVRVSARYFDQETEESLKRSFGRWDDPVMWSNPAYKGAYRKLPQRRTTPV